MDNRPIGIFDSGAGGLTVVKEAIKIMPNEHIVYLGDTARVPYGAKSRETVIGYGREIIQFLISKNVKAVIIACGTISSNGYATLAPEFDLPLIDVIRPGVRACLDARPRHVGFIATEATVRSGAFTQLLREGQPGIKIDARACPLFTPLVEEGWVNSDVTRQVAEIYTQGWANTIDTLVLGCTHYPLLTGVLRKVLGEDVSFINMAEYTAREAKRVLTERRMENPGGNAPAYSFYVSGYADKFERMVQMVLNKTYKAKKVDWPD